jgi:hypothetical protein
LDILKALVKDLEARPSDERARAINAILYIASIWPDRALVSAVHALARLPSHVQYRMFQDDAAVLKSFADNVQKQADLGTMLADTRAETARLQCEKDAASASLQACGERRGKSWLFTR